MKKYNVLVMIAQDVYIDVEAKNESEAIEEARRQVIDRLTDYTSDMSISAQVEGVTITLGI